MHKLTFTLTLAFCSSLATAAEITRINPLGQNVTVVSAGAVHKTTTPAASVVRNAYGTASEYQWIASEEFDARHASTQWGVAGPYNYMTRTEPGGDSFFHSALPLPNGAQLEALRLLYADTDTTPGKNPTIYLCRYWSDFDAGTNPGADCPYSATGDDATNGPGSILLDVNATIASRADLSPSPGAEDVKWVVYVDIPVTNGTIGFGGVRMTWRRQVAPAPSTATFADVPVTDLYHPFVEAIAAAGITSGCGSGNFCPDAPVLRRQMAVFIARALGLHWTE